MRVKKEVGVDYRRFVTKISQKNSAEDLGLLLKDFLKKRFGMKHQLTFVEIKEKIGKKKIDAQVKKHVQDLSILLEELEFRRQPATKPELAELRRLLRQAIKQATEGIPLPEPKKSPDKKRLHERKMSKGVTKVKKVAEQQVKNKVLKNAKIISNDDKEVKKMKRYVAASLGVGMKKAVIRKELKSMGFPSHKIDAVF